MLKNRNDRFQKEHHQINPNLPGQRLASPRRRALALCLDLVCAFVVCLPFYIAFVLALLHLQAPGLVEKVSGAFGGGYENGSFRDVSIELGKLFYKRKPEVLTAEMHAAFENNDREALEKAFNQYSFAIKLDQPNSYINQSTKRISVGRDVTFGRLASMVSILGFVFIYFTFFTWIFKGRTPGKWLLGIRVVKLSGKRLSLMDCFSRATGYTSSLSSLGMGFLQAMWTPNRRTTHDAIADTVVVHPIKEPKVRRKPTE